MRLDEMAKRGEGGKKIGKGSREEKTRQSEKEESSRLFAKSFFS